MLFVLRSEATEEEANWTVAIISRPPMPLVLVVLSEIHGSKGSSELAQMDKQVTTPKAPLHSPLVGVVQSCNVRARVAGKCPHLFRRRR